MENMTSIRIELGISAQKIMNHVIVNNETIEKQISKGIELAIDDLSKGDNFINHVRESVKVELNSFIHQVVLSYDVRQKIIKKVQESIDSKIQDYTDSIAEKIVDVLVEKKGDEKD